jgi:hypothetical protein
VNGGVPTVRDLQKFVSELFPRDVAMEANGPVPFGELFSLAEVAGADLPALNERSIVVAMRPSFSGGEVDPNAETMHAAPVWEDDDEDGHENRPDEEPNFDDGTDPGHAGPLERGWEAPPSPTAIHGKPRSGGTAVGARPALRSPRVKVIEDFSVVEPAPRRDEEPSISRTKRDPMRASRKQPVSGWKPPLPSDTVELKSPTLAEVPGFSDEGPRNTAERRLWTDALRRRKSLLIALAVAVAGVLFFIVAVVSMSSKAPRPKPLPPEPPVQAPQAASPSEPAPAPREIEWYIPPRASVRNTGYLSVTANRSAIVFIDGRRVKKQTPVKIPVLAGMRKVTLEAVSTQEKHIEVLTIAGGEEMAVHGEFGRGK